MFFKIFVQAIGFIAIGMNLIAVQFNTHGKIMLFKSLGSFLFCVQYFLLGAYTGMIMDFIGTVRNFVFANNVRKNRSNKWWIVFFSILTFALGLTTIILTWGKSFTAIGYWTSNPKIIVLLAVVVSILSIVAKLLTTVAYGFKNPHTIRMTNLPSCSMWLVYNFVCFSLAGIVNEIMSIGSIIIAELRFKKKQKEVEPQATENKD